MLNIISSPQIYITINKYYVKKGITRTANFVELHSYFKDYVNWDYVKQGPPVLR